MSLRDEIRAVLREELAAIGPAHAPATERVRVATGADLDRFARDLLARAANDPGFARRVADGHHRFEPEGAAQPMPPIVTGPPAAAQPRSVAAVASAPVHHGLLTERHVAAATGKTLRVAPGACVTPLARDEARRRGIRIERSAR